MTEEKKIVQPKSTTPQQTRPLPQTEEKGLPPVDYSPPTPPVKPPKKT